MMSGEKNEHNHWYCVIITFIEYNQVHLSDNKKRTKDMNISLINLSKNWLDVNACGFQMKQ